MSATQPPMSLDYAVSECSLYPVVRLPDSIHILKQFLIITLLRARSPLRTRTPLAAQAVGSHSWPRYGAAGHMYRSTAPELTLRARRYARTLPHRRRGQPAT